MEYNVRANETLQLTAKLQKETQDDFKHTEPKPSTTDRVKDNEYYGLHQKYIHRRD